MTLTGDQAIDGRKAFTSPVTVPSLNVGGVQSAVIASGPNIIVGPSTSYIRLFSTGQIQRTSMPANPSDYEIATVGWVNENGGKVKTVNNIEPDDGGNIEIDAVTSVDGHEPDSEGAVSFNLAGNKFVKTDASGHLTTSDTGGETVTKKVITNVSWNSSTNRFDIDSEQWEFEDGLLKSITANQQTHIATVTYTGN